MSHDLAMTRLEPTLQLTTLGHFEPGTTALTSYRYPLEAPRDLVGRLRYFSLVWKHVLSGHRGRALRVIESAGTAYESSASGDWRPLLFTLRMEGGYAPASGAVYDHTPPPMIEPIVNPGELRW